MILRLARECRNIQFNGVKISRLQDLQANYAMLYPARLWVIARGQAHFFESAAEASDWLEDLQMTIVPKSSHYFINVEYITWLYFHPDVRLRGWEPVILTEM